jgi:sugar phosphate isomerase/epimerase
MEAKPLSKIIHAKAKELGVEMIVLQFSGGSDEGYLNVDLIGKDSSEYRYDEKAKNFAQEIEEWAWEVYDYSGAGDGSNYGDNITYDLENNEVRTDEWYDAPNYTNYPATKLELQ